MTSAGVHRWVELGGILYYGIAMKEPEIGNAIMQNTVTPSSLQERTISRDPIWTYKTECELYPRFYKFGVVHVHQLDVTCIIRVWVECKDYSVQIICPVSKIRRLPISVPRCQGGRAETIAFARALLSCIFGLRFSHYTHSLNECNLS